jgi:tRNA G10  N-methylase Trm11
MKNKIYTMGAIDFLKQQKDVKIIITSIPDFNEIGCDLNDWIDFLNKILSLMVECTSDDSILFFYQTDRKYNGKIIDKKSIISDFFHKKGFNTIMSKIILKQNPETINLYRPTFSNLFAFSKNIKSSKATPDVLYQGKMLYDNAMGANACQECINFLNLKKIKATIVDPFCGQGTTLIFAKNNGFDYIGCDIDINQTNKAINNLNTLF